MNSLKKFWSFLKEDSWQSWIISLILIVIIIKLIIFPSLSFISGTKLPLVVVESCSMYHSSTFEGWWESHKLWYEEKNISKSLFSSFSLKSGLNKGDIVFVKSPKNLKLGNIIIFQAEAKTKYPIIHRIVNLNTLETKGDNNPDQLKKTNNLPGVDETSISESQVIGKAYGKIPYLGWLKLAFFEPFKKDERKGFCKELGRSSDQNVKILVNP